MKKISVIMPVYNAMPWLKQAVASVLVQRDALFELIIIDDNSHDGSYEFACAAADKDERISVARYPGRPGVASSRDYALQRSQSEYVFFLDGDDVIFPNSLERLYARAYQSKAPVVGGQGMLFCNQRWLTSPLRRTYTGEISDTTTQFAYSPPFFLHLIERDFLARNSLSFFEDLSSAEDTAFISECYASCPKSASIEDTVYLYRVNHKSGRPVFRASMNKLRCSQRVIAAFTKAGKPGWIVPFLDRYIINTLPDIIAIPAQTEPLDHALALAALCRENLEHIPRELPRLLRNQFGNEGDRLFEAVAARDDKSLLDLLCHVYRNAPQTRQPLKGPSYYLPRRAANWFRSPATRRTVTYLRKLSHYANALSGGSEPKKETRATD